MAHPDSEHNLRRAFAESPEFIPCIKQKSFLPLRTEISRNVRASTGIILNRMVHEWPGLAKLENEFPVDEKGPVLEDICIPPRRKESSPDVFHWNTRDVCNIGPLPKRKRKTAAVQ